MVITMFKSVIDTSPILFVKIGQEQVGAIDFRIIAANGTDLNSADINYYDIDPWNNPYTILRSSSEEYAYPVKDGVQIREEAIVIDSPVLESQCALI